MWTDSSQQILRIVRAYGAVAAVAQRLLGDDRRRVHQPGDHPDVGPPDGRIVEDVVELGLARQQVIEHRLARLAQVLRHAIEQLRMPDLVLDLGGQGQLAAERRGTHQPLSLREHAHQLGVGVHLDEPQHSQPVLVRHPVGGFDLQAGRDVGFEQRVPLVVRQVLLVEARPAPFQRPEDRLEGARIRHPAPSSIETARSDRSAYALAIARGERRPSGRYHATIPFSAVRM